MTSWPQQFLQHQKQDLALPCISTKHRDLTPADAYNIQKQYVALTEAKVRGYKAALTAVPAQQLFGINSPITGVLLETGDLQSGANLPFKKGIKLETEVGYIVREDINMPVAQDTVLHHISDYLPMIEVARPYFNSRPDAVDLIATNSASHIYIRGRQQAIQQHMIDQFQIAFARDTETLHSASSGNLMEGQVSALCWLINRLLELDFPVRAGHLLMTGSLGGVHDGLAGSYTADFGELGTVALTIS